MVGMIFFMFYLFTFIRNLYSLRNKNILWVAEFSLITWLKLSVGRTANMYKTFFIITY